MPAGDVETFYWNNEWHNRIEGTDEVFGTDPTRGAAVWAGRARARKDALAHVVREYGGKVEQRHSYTDDPPGAEGARRAVWRPKVQ